MPAGLEDRAHLEIAIRARPAALAFPAAEVQAGQEARQSGAIDEVGDLLHPRVESRCAKFHDEHQASVVLIHSRMTFGEPDGYLFTLTSKDDLQFVQTAQLDLG